MLRFRNSVFILLALCCGNLRTDAQVNDSLLSVWQNRALQDTIRINAINDLAWNYLYNQTDSALIYANSGYDLALKCGNEKKQSDLLTTLGIAYLVKSDPSNARAYFEKSFELSAKNKDEAGMSSAYNNLGSVALNQGSLPEAMQYFTNALELFVKLGKKEGQAKALNNLGLIFEDQGDLPKALENFESALEIKREIGKPYGTCYINIGNVYQVMGNHETALGFYEEAKKIFIAENDLWNAADALAEIAGIKSMTGDDEGAMQDLEESITMSQGLGNLDGEGFARLQIGKLLVKKGQSNSAISWCNNSLKIAEQTLNLQIQAESCECLSEANKNLGQFNKALMFKEKHIALRDSLKSLQQVDEVARLAVTHEYDLKKMADSLSREEDDIKQAFLYEKQMEKEKNSRNFLIVVSISILAIAILLASRLRFVSRTKKIIQQERERSDNLLLNILPASVAQELKSTGKSEARHFDNVTVLFTDFKDFTLHSEKLSAADLISEVDWCFQNFDVVAYRFGLEKIKTIGDAYMAVAGLNDDKKSDASSAVSAAIEMQRIIDERYAERHPAGLPAFRMRVGLHTGSVVAGVVGLNKFQYDVWGDVVNTASRVESSGEVGRVNISIETKNHLASEDHFKFIPRGKIAIKNKGEMEMFFVEKTMEPER